MAIGDNQHGLALIEASDDLIHHRRIDEHIDQRKHRRCHAKEECGNQHDETVEREKHAAHVQIIVLSHDRCKDVESARTAVHAEHQAVAEPCEYTAIHCCQHHIVHRCIGIEWTCEIEQKGKNRCTDDNIDRIRTSHQLPRHEEQRNVIDERLQTDRQSEQIVDNHRNSGCTAREQMRRNEK